jgi:branched-chain amino acid transport system permease protein
VVLAFPQGIIGLVSPIARWITGGPGRKPPIVAPERILPKDVARLAVEAVSVRIGEVTVPDRLTLAFDRPGIFCIIGPNGAGKTSTFNLLTSELTAAAGRVMLDDADLTTLPSHRVARLGIGRKFQIPSIFPDLTIGDNLAIALWSGQASRLDLLRPSLRRWTSPMMVELSQRYPFLAASERLARELSHGQRQILELAMALLTTPRILLLDEPSAGLSPEETAVVIEVIRWAGHRLGGAIIVIEHDMSLVKQLAETVYVLHNGALLAQGTVAEIQANSAVQAVYIGGQK